MRKRFLVFFIGVIVALPLIIYAGGPTKDLKVTKIGSKKGPAIYSHTKHAKAGINDCKVCHHKGNQDDPCAKCHKGKKGKKEIHKNCKGCHKKMNKGPKSCKACHQKK